MDEKVWSKISLTQALYTLTSLAFMNGHILRNSLRQSVLPIYIMF